MSEVDTKLETLRAEVDKAVRAFTSYVASTREHENAYVTCWATYAEYTTVGLQREDETSSLVIIPDGQSYATSRGVFELGAGVFRGAR